MAKLRKNLITTLFGDVMQRGGIYCFSRHVVVLCLVWILSSVFIQAQTAKIDSLKHALATAKSDQQRISLLLYLAEEEQGELIISRFHAQQAYEIAQKKQDSNKMAESLNMIASALNEQGDFIQALQTAKNALTLASACADKRNIAMAYSQMGTSHWRQGNNDIALELAYQALHMQEDIQDKKGMALTLGRIGLITRNNGKYEQARQYYFQALSLSQSIDDHHRASMVLIYIGASYYFQQKFDSALFFYQRAYEIGKKENDSIIILYSLINFGETYTSMNDVSKATPFLLQSLQIANHAKSWHLKGYIFTVLSNLNRIQHKFNDAVRYANLAITLADSLNARPDKRDALKSLTEAYNAQGNSKAAFEAYKNYILLRDSIVNDENSKKAAFREAKYNTDKKDKEILLLKKDAENQTFVRNSLLGGLCLVGIIVVVLIRNNVQRKKANDALNIQAAEIQLANTELQESLETLRRTQTQLAQAEKMASLGTLVAGVAHELNTPIGVAVTAASTLHGKVESFENDYKAGGLKKSVLETFIEQSKIGSNLTLRNLERAANLIQSFKQVAVDQTSDNKRVINLKHYIEGVMTSLEPKWKTTKHRVEIDCDEGIELETYPGAIAQIITNLVTNSLLHGFEGFTEEGEMKIKVEREGSNIIMKYSDNGRGIPPEILPRIFDPFFTTKQAQGGTGLGMHIVYNLVTQKLGGTVSVVPTESGARFEIVFSQEQ